MRNKVVSGLEAISHIKDGMTVMVGGFGDCGRPYYLEKLLCENNTAKELTLINNALGNNDAEYWAQYFIDKRVKKALCTYPRNNRPAQDQMFSGEIEYEVMPMGTFIERIHAGGSGIAAFYTPAGVHTPYADDNGKEYRTFNGRDYILETALYADVGLVCGKYCDEIGNVVVKGTGRNFNLAMAMASKYTVVQVDEVVKIGDIDPDDVYIPNGFINAIVKVGE